MIKKTLILLLTLSVLPLAAAAVSFKDSTVTATGHASLLVLPDAATVGFTVEITEAKLGDINQKAMVAVSDLNTRLAKLGVTRPLVHRGPGSVYGQLNYDSQRFEYTLTLYFDCAIDDLSLVDKVLELTETQASDNRNIKISVADITYTVQDMTTYLTSLREKALKQAKDDAEKTASAYSVTLGNLVVCDETPSVTGYSYTPYSAWDFKAQDMGGKSNLARIIVSLDLIATYEIK